MDKRFTWISYVSLLFSFIPIILFYLVGEGIIGIDFTYFTELLIYVIPSSIILSFILSITALIKKSENKLISTIALLLTIGGGLLAFIVFGMGQP